MTRRRWSRRGFLLWTASVTPVLPADLFGRREPGAGRAALPAQEPWTLDREALLTLASVLLPDELGDDGRAAAVDDFLAWLRGYRADAEMDHGYGFTRLRYTAPHPGPRYRHELAEMDRSARERAGAGLTELSAEALRDLVTGVLEEAVDAEGQLPSRPVDAHVTVDLMAHWLGSAEATDRCYGRAIRRETCRGLLTDVDELAPLDPDGRP